MKKRNGIAAVVMMLAGCTKPNTTLKPLVIETDSAAHAPVIRWEKPEEGDVQYKIVMQAVSGKDGGAAVDRIGEETITYESYSGMKWIAWYAQENDYYGPMRYQVTALISDTAVCQGYSDIFVIKDYFPAEKVKQIDAETINGFCYSGSGESMEHNFIFDIREEDGKYILTADYTDAEDRHEIEKEITEEQFQELRRYAANGTVVRRTAEDPEWVKLDGSEERFQISWNEETELEKNWYEWIPEQSETEAVKTYLKEISRG